MIQIESPQSQTSRSTLIAAFRRVVAINGRRQATDLHVRRLLCYIRAKDVDGQGAQRSLKQIANRLVLSVSTCRCVIRRAVKRFGLLIVIPQRHTPGGQTVNRYTINWHHVDSILGATGISSSAVQFARAARTPGNTDVLVGSMPVRLAPDVLVGSSDLPSGANTGILKSRARSKRIPPASESIYPGDTDMSVQLRPLNAVSHMPVRLAPNALVGSSDLFSSTSAFPQRATASRRLSSTIRHWTTSIALATRTRRPRRFFGPLLFYGCPSVLQPRIPCPLRSAAGPHQLPVRLAPCRATTSHPHDTTEQAPLLSLP